MYVFLGEARYWSNMEANRSAMLTLRSGRCWSETGNRSKRSRERKRWCESKPQLNRWERSPWIVQTCEFWLNPTLGIMWCKQPLCNIMKFIIMKGSFQSSTAQKEFKKGQKFLQSWIICFTSKSSSFCYVEEKLLFNIKFFNCLLKESNSKLFTTCSSWRLEEF